MAEQFEKPSRKHPFHKVIIHEDKPTIVYLTVCTDKRTKWLATSNNHQLLKSVWSLQATAWQTGKYVIMPDHIHLFAAPGEKEIRFDNWVRYWKSQFRKSHGINQQRLQVGHWDTQLRDSDSYEEKWEYVRNNPVRHGYVTDSDDWPFQGEIFQLPWFY